MRCIALNLDNAAPVPVPVPTESGHPLSPSLVFDGGRVLQGPAMVVVGLVGEEIAR
jgi:hypothetical protein